MSEMNTTMQNLRPINVNVRIGHVHLKVADLERSLGFYRDVLGFAVTQRYGRQAVFLSAGGYHHHIGLNTWESAGGDRHRRPARLDFTMSRSCIRTGPNWPMPGNGSAGPASPSRALPTTGSARPFTCAILTATVWSCTATGRNPIGRV